MKYRAIIKKVDDWWIGWLVDLPGVNAQEKTIEELVESLRIGAEDILATEVPFEPGAQMLTIDVPEPNWIDAS
ncbi:MAG: type II toxin-antitoxin system HicB family antitoxin [Desulfoferrobacter sp.]